MRYDRLITDIGLIISAFILPWWLTLLLALPPLFYFARVPFLEILFLGFLLDMLYAGGGKSFPFSAVFTFTAFVLFFGAQIFKKRLRFYDTR